MILEFINRPDGFYMNITGAIYRQETPFQQVFRDWNNDGDIYAESVATFGLIGDKNAARDSHIQPPKRLIYTRDEINELQRKGALKITY